MAYAPVQYKVAMRLPSLDGGLNTKYTDIGTPINASPDLQNVLFDEYGAVRTTPGYVKFNAVQIASSPIDGLSTYIDPSGDRILIAACNGSYYQQAGSSFQVISGSTAVYTAGVDVKILLVDGKVVFGNGYTETYKYNGENFVRFGVSPPDALASAVVQAGSALSGVYNWGLSYLNSYGVESDIYKIVSSYPVSGTNVLLTDISIAPSSYGVDSKILYRTTAAASATYWVVTALSATQTTVVDDLPDTALFQPGPVDQGVPPRAKYMVYYRGRVFAAGDESAPYRLYYSNGGAVETWPSTNYIDVEKGDGYPISAIEAFGNAIIIHKNDGRGTGNVYLLYIADSTGVSDDANWYVFKSPAAFSAISDKSQTFFRNLLFYMGRYGTYAFTGQDLARSSADSEVGRFQADALTYDIDNDVKTWNASLLERSASIMYDNKVWLAVPASGSTAQNNNIYVYDFVRMSDTKLGVWSKLNAPSVNNFVVSDGTLYAGGYDGYIYKLQSGTTNDGTAISPYYWTAAISGLPEHRDNTKVFRILYITHDCPGNWPLYVDYEVDFGASTQAGTVDLNAGGSLWGSMLWGVSLWGGGVRSKRSRLILPNATGKIIRFKFYVTGLNESFKIKELELEYNLRSKR